MNPTRTVRDLSRALRAAGDPARAVGARAYLKSDLDFWGVVVPDLRRVSKGWLAEQAELGHDDLITVVRAMWAKPVHELRIVGVELLRERIDLLGPDDVPLVEDLLRRSRSWAYVDALAPKVMGPLFVRHPALGKVLDRWVADPDFWIRRAALLTLLDPLRRGGGDWERFVAYADRLIEEREFFIRKAIGWILREVGKRDPVRVRRFLAPRRDRVSALTWREATKYLPAAELATLGERGGRSRRRTLRVVTVDGAGPRPGVHLDRTSELFTADDEVAFRPGEGVRRDLLADQVASYCDRGHATEDLDLVDLQALARLE